MANDEMGCCGYDELAEKPPTTQPLRFGAKMRTQNVWKNSEGSGITRRITPGSSMGSVRTVWMSGVGSQRPQLGQFSMVANIVSKARAQQQAAQQAAQQASSVAQNTAASKASADQAKDYAEQAKKAAEEAEAALKAGNQQEAMEKACDARVHSATAQVYALTTGAPAVAGAEAPASTGGGGTSTALLVGGGILVVGGILFAVLR